DEGRLIRSRRAVEGADEGGVDQVRLVVAVLGGGGTRRREDLGRGAAPRSKGYRLHRGKRGVRRAGCPLHEGRRAVTAGDEQPPRSAPPGEPGDLGSLEQLDDAPERIHVEQRARRPLVACVALVPSLLVRHGQAVATRVRYFPSRVSIFRTSPSLMKRGTL